jgi:hypothetical protein
MCRETWMASIHGTSFHGLSTENVVQVTITIYHQATIHNFCASNGTQLKPLILFKPYHLMKLLWQYGYHY